MECGKNSSHPHRQEGNGERVSWPYVPIGTKQTGPLVTILIEHLSCRIVIMLGSLISMTGNIWISYATNINEVIVACVLIGFGLSMVYFASMCILNTCFDHYFILVVSICTTVRGLAVMIAPFIYMFGIEQYGWKGTYLIIAALHYQICGFGAAVKIPADRVIEDENIPLTESNEVCIDTDCPNIPQHPSTKRNWLMLFHYVYRLCHLSVFKNATFCMLFIVYLLYGTSAEGFLLIMTDDTNDIGATVIKGQLMLVIFGCGSLLGRPFHFICSTYFSMDLIKQLALSLTSASLSLLICTVWRTEISMQISALLFGFTSGWIYTLSPLIAKYHIDCDTFSSRYAFIEFAYGVGVCIGIPITGWLRDVTGTYRLSEFCFFMLEVISATIVMTFIVYKNKYGSR